jgi:hypothetical protein
MLLALAQAASAGTYVVLNLNDSGPSSLRWCIEHANANAASDTITFDKLLAGGTIRPATQLPELTGYYGDTLNGDVNDDGKPDFTLRGDLLSNQYDYGLMIHRPQTPTGLGPSLLEIPHAPPVPGCTIAGLAIVDFPGLGIYVMGRGGNTIRRCHLGVNRAGDVAMPNGQAGVFLFDSDGNTVGGRAAKDRNVIVGGPGDNRQGLLVAIADGNVIIGNYFGTDRAGTAALGNGNRCLDICEESSGTQVGGGGGSRNLFCGHETGIVLRQADSTRIQGNYFGLGSDGATSIPLQSTGIHLLSGPVGTGHPTYDSRIGGTTQDARNVFAGPFTGIVFEDPWTQRNQVVGNDFGATADSTEQRDMTLAISLRNGAGAQTIGGSAAGAGNYFTVGEGHQAVSLLSAGADTYIVGNSFGLLRSGTAVDGGCGVGLTGVKAFITDNVFARLGHGIEGFDADSDPRVFRNVFRTCGIAVAIGGHGNLGNLSNASTADDGGNTFRPTNTWHISNSSPNRIRAEGNRFGTTVESEIDLKIHDKLDDPTTGRVDFDPLAGGVHPTGVLEAPTVAVTGATALATSQGAEILFSLSAPAEVSVEVLNVAGRPVASLPTRACPAGLQRVPWTGCTTAGTATPAGTYLVRITARGVGGGESAGLARLALR